MKRNPWSKLLVNVILPLFVVVLLAGNILNTSFAVISGDRPDVVIEVDSSGNSTQTGNLFGDDFWFPGKSDDGIIRISNQYKTIKVSNVGLNVELHADSSNGKRQYDYNTVYESFIDNMKITIEKGKLLNFGNSTLVNHKPIRELLNGFKLKESDQFSIARNDLIDLKYTLHMDEASGNELQGLTAEISFLINVDEVTTVTPPDNDKDKGDKDKSDDLMEEELLEVIPDLSGHWAHDCIIALLEHGIIKGYPDGTIKPDNYITRAEAAALVAKALQLEEKSHGTATYGDDIPAWARGFIYATSDKDIFKGYPDGTFKPDKYITREEMTTVLIKAFNRKLQEDMVLNFPDQDDIGPWAEEFVKASVQHEVIAGYPDGTFKPKKNITRAEAFTIICKLLGYHAEHNVGN